MSYWVLKKSILLQLGLQFHPTIVALKIKIFVILLGYELIIVLLDSLFVYIFNLKQNIKDICREIMMLLIK